MRSLNRTLAIMVLLTIGAVAALRMQQRALAGMIAARAQAAPRADAVAAVASELARQQSLGHAGAMPRDTLIGAVGCTACRLVVRVQQLSDTTRRVRVELVNGAGEPLHGAETVLVAGAR